MKIGNDDRIRLGMLSKEEYRVRFEKFLRETEEIVRSRVHLKNCFPPKMIFHTDTGEVETKYDERVKKLDDMYQEALDDLFKRIVIKESL